MDVLEFSQKTKQEADELLKYGSVIETLSEYGQVFLTGSYSYDLMYGPDIDIVVVTDRQDEHSHNAFLDFIDQKNFQKYQLGDFKTFPMRNRPEDIIIVLIHEYKGRRWEIEIWFKEIFSDSYFDNLASKATDEQRKIILELKKQREINNLSKNQLASSTIYQGVISQGKTTLEEYIL